jgi:hypothetical protein
MKEVMDNPQKDLAIADSGKSILYVITRYFDPQFPQVS